MKSRLIAGRKPLGWVTALVIAFFVAAWVGASSRVTAQGPATRTPYPKDDPRRALPGVGSPPTGRAGAQFSTPAPGSKNDPRRAPAAGGPASRAVTPPPGSKNASLPETRSDAAFSSSLGDPVVACGASGNLDWTTTSTAWQVIRQCTLTVAEAGWVFISANASLARTNGAYEAQFEIGIDTTAGDESVDRWVNVYDDAGDGTDKSAALSVRRAVTAGTHTVYFLGARFTGPGTVLLYDPTLSVIYAPMVGTPVLSCGGSWNLNWYTTADTFQVIHQCTLTVLEAGWVYLSADASAARSDGEYEATFRLGIDSTVGDGATDRWVNVYNDAGDGTDESVAVTIRKPVGAGTHTFYFLGSRYTGPGTVLLYDPTLSVIYAPSSSAALVACGHSGEDDWASASNTFQVIRQCTLTMPHNGWIYLSADGSVARTDGEYEAQFEIGIDTTVGDWNVDRWINIYNDAGDGTDRSVALSALKPISAGTHTLYFLGRRYSGPGTALVCDPSLTVLAGRDGRVFLPFIQR